MSHAGLWVITWGGETHGANQVVPRHQVAHLVCAAQCGGAYRPLGCCGRVSSCRSVQWPGGRSTGQRRGERRLMNTLDAAFVQMSLARPSPVSGHLVIPWLASL